jgi:hypothetical protein
MIVLIETVYATQRLVLRGGRFRISNKVAAEVARGITTRLADEFMAALGNSFESLSIEDVLLSSTFT